MPKAAKPRGPRSTKARKDPMAAGEPNALKKQKSRSTDEKETIIKEKEVNAKSVEQKVIAHPGLLPAIPINQNLSDSQRPLLKATCSSFV